MGLEEPTIDYMTDKPVEVRIYAADMAWARELLGWKPQFTLAEGLARTVNWHTVNHHRDHVHENLETLLYER